VSRDKAASFGSPLIFDSVAATTVHLLVGLAAYFGQKESYWEWLRYFALAFRESDE
jgi:hypothetical protein